MNFARSRFYKLLFSIGALTAVSLAYVGAAQAEGMTTTGSARVRYEHKSDADFNDNARDNTDFILSRFRLNMAFQPSDEVSVLIQPQFSKTWGETEFVPSGAAANTATNTSGATNDTALDVHQAHLTYKVNDEASVAFGRKELSYGDQLLVGEVGWSNTGRAFDVILAKYKYEMGTVDAFSAKVKDVNYSSVASGDKDFYGVYSSNKISDALQALDLYWLYSYDATGVNKAKTTAYGVRAKSQVAEVYDYRVEVTSETVEANDKDSGEHQFDVEAGYMAYEPKKVRVSAEYFEATNDFDQLYPTGHKWLGYADLFSRRNIKGYRVGVSSQIDENWRMTVDYHSFSRLDDEAPAYKFSGAAYAAAGTDTELASEMDVVVGRKLNEQTQLELGYADVTPGKYMETNAGKDNTQFYYLQLSANF